MEHADREQGKTENVSPHQTRKALAYAFVKYLQNPFTKENVNQTIKNNGKLFERCVQQGDEDEATDILVLMQQEAIKYPEGASVFAGKYSLSSSPLFSSHNANTLTTAIARALVFQEIVDAEGVEAWWNSPRSVENQAFVDVREETKEMVDYLLESDDSEESEEEEDSD